jgi:signal transduction histidine kinase
MSSGPQKPHSDKLGDHITEEYRVLHQVAQILQTQGDLVDMLQNVLKTITEFEDLKVENKAGIFLADHENQALRLFAVYGDFSEEFITKEQKVPFGECLCGRVALSGKLLMSESCFKDPRHERTFSDMEAHGHYIVPLKSLDSLVGVMFLYTDTYPSWYQHSQEVLLSIGGLIADTIKRKQIDKELEQYKDQLEHMVDSKTIELRSTNEKLTLEIEEHKSTQEHLKSSRDQFRMLSSQIQEAREEEKSRISREVHDRLGQSLTALKMDSVYIEKKLPPSLEEIKRSMRSMTQLIDTTITSVQEIAMELRPPILDAFGLCEAIAWQAGEYNKKLGIEFNLNCLQEHIELKKDLNTALFRIFQETLTNIVRHAQATKIQVSLNLIDGHLIFIIEDDGKGIEKEVIHNPESIGLIGIRERAWGFNGRVQFDGFPGKGTRVTVKIPLEQ